MRRPSPALVLSFVAVFLAATGGAVAGVQIGGKQIKDGSIAGKDVKNNSLSGTDIKGDVRGPEGPRGARGAQGPAGPAGSAAAGVAVSYRLQHGQRSGRCRTPEGLRRLPQRPGADGGQPPHTGRPDAQLHRLRDLAGGNPDSWVAVGQQPYGGPAGRRASRWPASGRAASTLFNSSPRELAR